MASVKSHGPLTVGTVTVRRKPALTYQSPAQNTAMLYTEKPPFTSQSATASPLPSSPPTCLSQMPELSRRSAITHKSNRHHVDTPLLPLYHPFGTLALSLPDLDPTAFGLPAPVAVFDDLTRRSSNRQRRPAAKVRDADDAATPHPPSFTVTPTPELEVREKSSPRRRRGGGPSGKRKRREPEDGDATYPAKRPRHPRFSGLSSGLSDTRALSREEGSPTLSNAHTGTSPGLAAKQSELAEEKKPERRTTRSRKGITRRDSTASEDTATSASASVSATNTAVPRVASSGEPTEVDEPATNVVLNEVTSSGAESGKVGPNGVPVLDRQEN